MTIRERASDFDRRILELYDGYVHGRMSKRQFLDHAAKYTVGGATAAAVLESLQPDYALAQQVAPGRPGDHHRGDRARFARGQRHGARPLAQPAGAEGPLPAVLVVRREPRAQPTSRTCGAWQRPASWRSGRTG